MARAKSKRKRSTKAAAPHPLLQRAALVLTRVFPGLILIDAVQYKLSEGGDTIGAALENFWRADYRPLIERAIASPPEIFGHSFDAYGRFLEAAMLGSETWERVLSGGILAVEGLIGVCLVIGLCTRFMGILGALLMTAFGLAKSTYFLTVNATNWTLAAMMLVAAFLAAGAGARLGCAPAVQAAPVALVTQPDVLIQCEQVSVARGEHVLLERASLAVSRGERVSLIGPNGAGKTTLLRVLGGWLEPDGGHVRIHGAGVDDLSRRAVARRVAAVLAEEGSGLSNDRA